MEVYQRRENLRFFGIKEEADMEEDARDVLNGKRVSSNGKPRQIIARFLKYPQREDVQC